MSGNAIPGRTHDEQYASLLEGSKRAGDLVAAANLTAIVGPLNSLVNHKGFFLTTYVEGAKLTWPWNTCRWAIQSTAWLKR